MSDFWQFFWFAIEIFLFFAYLIIFFQIISDLFRDKSLGGWAKAAWVIGLMIFPLIGALVYLIARGEGMTERSARAAATAEEGFQHYIRETAGTSPAAEISAAQALLEKGAITQAEFDTLKAKALA